MRGVRGYSCGDGDAGRMGRRPRRRAVEQPRHPTHSATSRFHEAFGKVATPLHDKADGWVSSAFGAALYRPARRRVNVLRMKSAGGSVSASTASRIARGSPNRLPWP